MSPRLWLSHYCCSSTSRYWKIFDKEVHERAVRGCIVDRQMDKEVMGQLFPYVGYHITWKRNVGQELPGQLFEKNSLQCGARDLSEIMHLRIWEYRDQMCKILQGRRT